MATCKTGHTEAPEDSRKCLRCGVALGDPFERALTELESYEEGCEPRRSQDLGYGCARGYDE